MSGARCRHRRARPVLQALFVIALVLVALGYGLIRGTALGYADAARSHTVAATSCLGVD